VSFLKLEEMSKKKAQIRLRRVLGDFVNDYDDEDNLLILYYAGHGFVRGINPEQNELMGWRGPRESGYTSKMLWNSVENFLDETSSDVLEIVDCCYAGDLGEPKPGQTAFCKRSFEYIAATSARDETNSPGKMSFTSALIWALNEFSLPGSCTNFTVTDLVQKIRQCPDFPKDQVPVSTPRNIDKMERIILGPLITDEEAIRNRQNATTRIQPLSSTYHVHLDFQYNSLPTTKAIEDLANELKSLRKRGLDVSRISWQGIHSGLALDLDAADRLYQPLRERMMSPASQTPTSTVSPTIGVNFVVPEANDSTSTTSQQADLQSAAFHLKMFSTIVSVTMTCKVASTATRLKTVILILTTVVAFVIILTVMYGDGVAFLLS
jgi:hypothetical protein